MTDSIEGNPFIIRFKTSISIFIWKSNSYCIEGNPFIIRFKTDRRRFKMVTKSKESIEGNPFIIRFKTSFVNPSLSTGMLWY